MWRLEVSIRYINARHFISEAGFSKNLKSTELTRLSPSLAPQHLAFTGGLRKRAWALMLAQHVTNPAPQLPAPTTALLSSQPYFRARHASGTPRILALGRLRQRDYPEFKLIVKPGPKKQKPNEPIENK